MSQARFQKFQREKARREKAEAKRQRKADRAEAAANADDEPADLPPESRVLAQLASLHEKFDDGQMTFDEFEERKAELMSQIDV